MHLPWRRALSPTASKIFTPTALVVLTNFNIILALNSTSLLTSKFLSDFIIYSIIIVRSHQGIKTLLFGLLTEKKAPKSKLCCKAVVQQNTCPQMDNFSKKKPDARCIKLRVSVVEQKFMLNLSMWWTDAKYVLTRHSKKFKC